MIILLIWRCSFSSYVLSATVIPKEILSVKREETLLSDSNTSFIQQIMTWFSVFLKSLLTYKALLMIIPVTMVWILYSSDNTSLQSEPCKAHKEKGSPGSSKPSPKKRKQSDERTKVQPNQINENKKSEIRRQQLNVSNKEVPVKPCLGQKNKYITGDLRLRLPEKRKKSDAEWLNIRTRLPTLQLVRDDKLGKDWIHTQHNDERICIYRSGSQQSNEREHRSISNMIVLNNSFTFHQTHAVLWVNSEFYTLPELIALAITSKYSYIQFKKLSNIIIKKKPNSYMVRPGYKTCVIDVVLRVWLIENPLMKIRFISIIITNFKSYYALLLDKASKEGDVSYEFFTILPLPFLSVYSITVKHFLTRKFPEKHTWTFAELKSSEDTLIKELNQVMEEWIRSPNYNFIPPVNQDVDQALYERPLKRMESMKVPFYNCTNISRLFISSGDEPLKLFLFWDIFNALKMEITMWIIFKRCGPPFLKNNNYIDTLIYYITKVYINQDKKYLRSLYFELVDTIQHDFFENNQLYKKTQTKEQHQIAFDVYMLGIQAQIMRFLSAEVFTASSVGIRA